MATKTSEPFNRDQIIKYFQEANVRNMEKVHNGNLDPKEKPEVFKAAGGGAWAGWGKGTGSQERFAELLRTAFDKRPSSDNTR